MAQSPMAARVQRDTGLAAIAAVPFHRRPTWALTCVAVPVALAVAISASLWVVVLAAALGGGLVGGLTRWYYVARTADRMVLLRCKPFTTRPVDVVAELQPSDLKVLATTGPNTRLRAGTVVGTVPKRWTAELKALVR